MSHTPGPWVGTKDGGVKTADGKTVFETGCHCCTEPYLSEDDARLIAAAPELAEALQLLVSSPLRYANNVIEIDTGSYTESMEIVRKARAALARAGV